MISRLDSYEPRSSSLSICIHTHEFNTLDILIYHSVYRIVSCSTDSYY